MTRKKLDLRMKEHDDYLNSIKKGDKNRPNFLFILTDDMGYADISCYGSKAISTPNIDALAKSGVKLTNFYSASPVCSPSRFSCLTGRYPTRGFFNDVLFSSKTTFGRYYNSTHFPSKMRGILKDEITLPEALRASGYNTAMFGKWHLGDTSPSLPNDKGFDYFYGSYYSVDMEPYDIYKNNEIAIKNPVDKSKLTPMLTNEILNYLDNNHDLPFFIYYASPYPHHPALASDKFKGKSKGGTYGDCVEELDDSIGKIIEKLKELKILDNTLIIFTSDNGPWFEGNPGYHRGRKGENFDGGHMVPFIASCKNHIKENKEISVTAMNIDIFPTFLKLAGINLPSDRVIDGKDMMPILSGESDKPEHDEYYFITKDKVLALRKDNLKYIVKQYCDYRPYVHNLMGPFIFDLNIDPQESYNTINLYKDEADYMKNEIEKINEDIKTNPRGWKNN